MIRLKRAHHPPAPEDGIRILVERLWPRGISKERLALDLWLKEIAPSPDLRRWFKRDRAQWEEFRRRYRVELSRNKALVKLLRERSRGETITFVFASSDPERCSAALLREFIEGGQSQARAGEDP